MKTIYDIGYIGKYWARYNKNASPSQVMAQTCANMLDLLDMLGIPSAALLIDDEIDFGHIEGFVERYITRTHHLGIPALLPRTQYPHSPLPPQEEL